MKRKGWLLLVLGLVFLVHAGGIAWSQVTERVSLHSDGTQGDFDSNFPSISCDGRYVAFESGAGSLVDNDIPFPIGFFDVFVHELQTGTTTRVSLNHLDVTEGGNGHSYSPSISADGRYVAFESIATNLVPGGSNGLLHIFVHDRQTGTTTRVSVDSLGNQGFDSSGDPSISADGKVMAFRV